MKIILSFIISMFLMPCVIAQTANIAENKSEVKILPHRAYYTVKLEKANKDSSVENTDGRMIVELTHDCDGWTLRQESASVIDLKAQPSEMMRSVYTAKESEDGKTLNFKTERVFNEQTKDSVEGVAGFTEKGGTITYKSPEVTEIKMKEGTLPPIAHMKKLIEMAASGNKAYSIQVFDGSFFGNPVLINADLEGKQSSCNITDNKAPVYPMNLAVFAMPSTASNPNFEISQNMGSNGVMCSYKINFGDYSVKGTLDKVEFLPANACPVRVK